MGANVLDFPSVRKGQIFEQLRGRPSDLQPSTTGTILFARSGFQLSIKNIDGVDLNLTSLSGLQYWCKMDVPLQVEPRWPPKVEQAAWALRSRCTEGSQREAAISSSFVIVSEMFSLKLSESDLICRG